MRRRNFRIAIDIGGTFTDGVAQEVGSGRIWVGKCLTTPEDPGEGVLDVVRILLADLAAEDNQAEVSEVVHGNRVDLSKDINWLAGTSA